MVGFIFNLFPLLIFHSRVFALHYQVLIYAIIEELNTWKIKVKPYLNPVKPISLFNKAIRRVRRERE